MTSRSEEPSARGAASGPNCSAPGHQCDLAELAWCFLVALACEIKRMTWYQTNQIRQWKLSLRTSSNQQFHDISMSLPFFSMEDFFCRGVPVTSTYTEHGTGVFHTFFCCVSYFRRLIRSMVIQFRSWRCGDLR